jgi:hypothetical protein
MLTDALGACGVKGDVPALAEKMWAMLEQRRAKGFALGVKAYNARILERGTAGDWEGALQVGGRPSPDPEVCAAPREAVAEV